jgi:Fe-S-cluster containining protein
MHGQDSIFLTREEAVDAIRIDLQQYEPQTGLLCELFPVVMGANAVAIEAAGHDRVWVTQSARGPMRLISSGKLANILFGRMAMEAASPERLADFCTGVFREPAIAGFDDETRAPGVWIETGMEDYACKQCGYCCRTLDYHRECTANDYKRWQSLGRDDILQWVCRIQGEAKTAAYRIWVEPGTEQPVSICPFLQHEPGTEKDVCGIHAVKPEICRQYPFTRKHALMTGCPGFDQK